MITAELRAKIRRLFYAEHWKIGTIATELGVHHDTVRAAIESDRFNRAPPPVRPSILDPYRAFIEQTLDKHPRLRATRIHAMIEARGYTGSVVQLRRYVRKIRPRRAAEAYLQLNTLPGEQAQVDWGHFGKVEIGRARRALSCFVLVLSYSRAMFARFALDQTMESFLRGHTLGFEALGGAPREVLYDNLKSVVLERDGDYVRFHPAILELAGHYHFAPKPCAPYRANEKGKVERAIQYIRHSFFAARRFTSIEQLNADLAAWIDRTAHARPCPRDAERRPVRQVYEEEQASLLPLPEHPYPCQLIKAVASGKTPYVRFDLNDYSIPHTLVRRPLTLIATEEDIRLVDAANDVVARHKRSYDRGQLIEDRAHLDGLAEHKRAARALTGRDRLRSHCPTADAFIAKLAARNEPMRQQTMLLNRLLDRYGAQSLDAALRQALERGAVSATSVAHILDQQRQKRRELPRLEPTLPDDPRVRDLHVKDHDLAPYDELAGHGTQEDDQ